jgi:TatA/E family protein of Tat protein translocase
MLSVPHLIVIFIVALVVFGPEKIPELARNLGKVMAEFRRVTGDLRSTFEGHLRDLERDADARRIAAPAATPAAPTPAPSASPEASEGPKVPEVDATTAPSSGTVPAKPPNAAALPGAPADASSPSAIDPAPDVPNPVLDSYLDQTGLSTHDSSRESAASNTESQPEKVTDGDRRNS